MAILLCNREAIQLQIISNYIDAGIACKEEASKIEANLNQLDAKDLLTVLLESHNFREQKLSGQQVPYVDTSHVCRN